MVNKVSIDSRRRGSLNIEMQSDVFLRGVGEQCSYEGYVYGRRSFAVVHNSTNVQDSIHWSLKDFFSDCIAIGFLRTPDSCFRYKGRVVAQHMYLRESWVALEALGLVRIKQKHLLFLHCLHQLGGGVVENLLLKSVLDIHGVNERGEGLLHLAIQENCQPPLLLSLFQLGLNPGQQSKDGRTPLMLAVNSGKLEAAKLLLKNYSIDRATVDQGNRTVIILAARLSGLSDLFEDVQEKYEKQIKNVINIQDISGFTAAHYAVNEVATGRAGAIKDFKWLLEFFPRVDLPNDWGVSPFMLASQRGVLVKCFGNKGDMVDRQLQEIIHLRSGCLKQRTVMHFAASRFGNIADMTRLIGLGAAVHVHDVYRRTPLQEAIRNQRYDLVTLLLSKGGHCAGCDMEGCSPLRNAVQCGNCRVVALLLSKGASLSDRDYKGRTLLIEAVQNSQFVMMLFLIQKGANLYTVDYKGCNVLMYAVQGHVLKEFCEVLKFSYRDALFWLINATDRQGRTSWAIAKEVQLPDEQFSLLVKYGQRNEALHKTKPRWQFLKSVFLKTFRNRFF